MLHLQDVTGGYTGGHDILQGVNLHVPRGEAVGIIGLNGSGKSTLGRAILNTLPHRKGKIHFDGEDVSDLPTPRLANKGIAFSCRVPPSSTSSPFGKISFSPPTATLVPSPESKSTSPS